MRKIRNNVWESNSSSSHSLTIGDNACKLVDDTEIEIELGYGEYGWGYEELINWESKADYLAVEAVRDNYKMDMLDKALKLRFPNIEITYANEDSRGYIDHQSYGEIWNELDSVEDVYNVIFGSSIVVIDNDNG